MEKLPQVPQTYDEMFTAGGSEGVFDLPYARSPYYPMFKAVIGALQRGKVSRVLEVGCGTGTFAHMFREKTELAYRGFDFSAVAIEKAGQRFGAPGLFYRGDATLAETYIGQIYDAIVCTEVLEHIENDLLAVSQWAAGTWCVCSVPNYDADTHVRHFRTAEEVAHRYGHLIDIDRIETRRKPFLNDLSVGHWLQAVKWNRYRPDRLLWLLGLSSFERDGGWFIFSGRKRNS
ncbi:MAG: hypothetical protein C0505_03560 [Leptothrix sp. (in: Bacteria)]|nr:hypothetical protein [Leptothrix sp. (in: b-proteobacteria)]